MIRCCLQHFEACLAIRYTPGQFRDALGLTKETFRYWKRDLPALAAVAGHSPCFGPSELVATAIAKRAIDLGGASIGRLAPLASQLFALCEQKAWPQLERLSAVLFLKSGSVSFIEQGKPFLSDEPAIVVPMEPVIRELRERLLAADVEIQSSLAFPPVAVSSGKRQ
jgi:hypothetical protein